MSHALEALPIQQHAELGVIALQ